MSTPSTHPLCYVNGVRRPLPPDRPTATLLDWLRSDLGLTGTKLVCGEGGCGACTVLVSRPGEEGEGPTPVNACLCPLYSVDGCAVTTVEGLGGGPGAPLHPLQAALASAHGSQCGFCSPGFVVAAAGALARAAAANAPPPPATDIEDVLAGNLCRCTGYRPIVDAFRPFFGAGGDAAASEGGTHAPPTRQPGAPLPPCASSVPSLPSLPAELRARGRPPLCLHGETATWHRVTTLPDLLRLAAAHPGARLIGGNTEVGIEARQRGVATPVLVDVTAIHELAEIKQTDTGVSLGAAVTLARLHDAAADLATSTGPRGRALAALSRQLALFAGGAVRGAALLGGNLATASPIGDLAPIFMACGATMVAQREGEAPRRIPASEFFTGYRRTALAAGDVLLSVDLPWTRPGEHVLEFKAARRRDDDIAIVNACGRVAFGVGGEGTDDASTSSPPTTPLSVSIAYGGVADRTTLAPTVSSALATAGGWGRAALEAGLSALPSDVCLPPDAPGGMAAYRTTLAASFLARFIAATHAAADADAVAVGGARPPPLDSALADAAAGLPPRPPPSGLQYYDASTHDGAIIGAAIPHRAAAAQASGRAVYLADIPLPSTTLHAALVLSTRPHAHVVSIDTETAAATVPGYVAFYGAADVPGSGAVGPFGGDPLFAAPLALCVGHPVGIVLATTEAGARAAAAAVIVRYGDDLPAVLSIDDAIASSSFFDFPGLTITTGDVDAALATSDILVSGELRIGGQEHFYLEPQCALALPGEGDEITVWSSTQAPSSVQKDVASALGVATSSVDVKVKRLGGGFGGKETRAQIVAAAAAVAAVKSCAPVRLVLDRHVDMVVSGCRHPFLVRWKVGADADGTLTGADFQFYSNGGCSPDLSAPVMQRALLHAANAYSIPSLRAVGTVCRTNLPSNTAFRGFGAPQAMLAMERAMDAVAAEVEKRRDGASADTSSLDARFSVRARNLITTGAVTHYGTPVTECHATACWDGALASADVGAALASAAAFNHAHRWRKRGVAAVPTMFGASFTLKHYNQAGALVHVSSADGSVRVAHGGVEMGQGLHTKVAAVAAAVLNVPLASIHIHDTSTDAVANASPTAASVSSDLYGAAVADACGQLVQRLAPFRGEGLPFAAAAATAHAARVDLTAYGFYATPGIEGYGTTSPFHYACYGAAVAVVELDVLTGAHTIHRADVVIDVGAPLNPALDVGQVEGAFVQGAGWVTLEDVVRGDGGQGRAWLPRGATHTRGPGTYKLPAAGDAPADFRVTLLRGVRCGATPLTHASKAVGEPPFFLGAAVWFALRHAVGAARAELGLTGDFTLHSPATSEALRLACGGDECAAAAGVPVGGGVAAVSC